MLRWHVAIVWAGLYADFTNEISFKCFKSSSHTAAAPADRAAVKTELSDQKQHDNFFPSQLTKIKAILKLFWPLLIVNLRTLGFFLRGTAYLVCNNTTDILQVPDERRETCYTGLRRPILDQNRLSETHNVSYFSLFKI